MKTVKEQIVARIYGHGRGWAFSPTDFLPGFLRDDIDKTLSELTKTGTIRRVCRGIYDYPEMSSLLGQLTSPDPDQIAQAIARKFGWRIQPTGDTALNLLGLSTQVPAQLIYLSDGPSRTYDIGGRKLAFKNAKMREAGFRYRESALLVQAFKALGAERIDASLIKKARDRIAPEKRPLIVKDTARATGWVFETIRNMFSGEHA